MSLSTVRLKDSCEILHHKSSGVMYVLYFTKDTLDSIIQWTVIHLQQHGTPQHTNVYKIVSSTQEQWAVCDTHKHREVMRTTNTVTVKSYDILPVLFKMSLNVFTTCHSCHCDVNADSHVIQKGFKFLIWWKWCFDLLWAAECGAKLANFGDSSYIFHWNF